MKAEIVRDEPFTKKNISRRGRGRIQFPEFFDLKVSRNGEKGDCLVYTEISPELRKKIVQAKCNYNRRVGGQFKDKHFIHRDEIRHGEHCLVVQRIV